MKAMARRFTYLTESTRGLLLMVTAWDAIIVALLGILSRPMQEMLGINIVLDDAERIGRIIMLYHSLAIPFVAALVYLILDMVPTSKDLARRIRAIITPGYMLVSIGGLTFAYLGHNWVFHSLFLLGQSLVFYAGILLAVGLWPGRHRNTDPAYAHWGSISLERMAFFAMAVCTLISVIIGAVVGSFFGNGFEAFLAEDIVRVENKPFFHLAIIAHLHIMLALIDVAIFLILVRKFDLKGTLHKIALPITIVGTIIMSAGCWSVMVVDDIGHKIIYGGSGLILVAALLMTIDGIGKMIRDQLAEQGISQPSRRDKWAALVRNPLQFGLFFQLIWMNFVMVFPGLYTAIKLDEVFRVWPYEAERRILVGHWHILATISAVMLLFIVADRLNVRGWVRQVLGWGVIIGGNVAFSFAVVYEFLPPDADRQWSTLFIDAGIILFLVVLAIFLARRLVDLFKARGMWNDAA